MTLAASVQNVRHPHAVTLLVFGGFGPIAGVFVFGGLQGGFGGMLVFPAFAALGAAILPYKTIGLMFVVAVVPGLLAGLAAHMVRERCFALYAGMAAGTGSVAVAIPASAFALGGMETFVATAVIVAVICAALTRRLTRR